MQTGAHYQIARPTGVCAATNAPLTPGEPCIACLCESESDDGFERIDFSVAAWESGARPERLYSYWKMTSPEPTDRKRVFVDDELLLNLFERLEGDDRPQRIAFRFVIALVLLRKRKLRQVGRRQEPGGAEVWQFTLRTPAGTPPPPVDVINPRLSDEDVRAVSDQLGEILNGALE